MPTNGLSIVALVWWLKTITALPVAAATVVWSQANCAGSSEPSAYPLGFTVSSTTNRKRPLSK